MSRARTAVIAFVALVLVVGVAWFVPRGEQERGALTPQARQDGDPAMGAAAAGLGTVGPEAQAEIDRVLGQGVSAHRRLLARSAGELQVLARGVAAAASGTATDPALARPLMRTRGDKKAASLTQALNGSLGGGLVRAGVRCVDLEGQRYCLGSGWTTDTQAQVRASTLATARRVAGRGQAGRTGTGDLDVVAALTQRARMRPAARVRGERRELEDAARAVAKVWLLRHQVEGVALPDGFLARHPEVSLTGATGAPAGAVGRTLARATPEEKAARKAKRANRSCVRGQKAKGVDVAKARKRCKRAAAKKLPAADPAPPVAPVAPVDPVAPVAPMAVKTYDDYPAIDGILDNAKTAEQVLTYWCGPAAMQMIGWNATGVDEGQAVWAQRLGTTRSGSSITRMVRAVNDYTTYDDAAGPYVTLDIADYTYEQWMLLMMQQVTDKRTPVVLHPVLLKKYYPYLDDDASGHFQVGRGYDKKGDKSDLLGYFEPWNQQRFDPSEPAISRVQWRQAYKSYRANQDHFQHNVGV